MKKKLFITLFAVLTCLGALIAFGACGEDIIDKLMPDPENIAYDGARITWDKIADADHYTVKINDGEEKRVNTNSYAFDSEGTDFSVTVGAVMGEHTSSASMDFTALATIKNVAVGDDGVLSWESVPNATAYALQLNGKVQDISIADTVYNKLPVGANRVKIRPIVAGDASYYSLWSAEKSVTILGAPMNLKYDGYELSWGGVSGAATYEVTIGGSVQTVSGATKLEYDAQHTDFEVNVRAIGNHSSTYDSAAATEKYTYLEPVTAVTVEDGILCWEASANATGYKLKINGVTQAAVAETNRYEKLEAGKSLTVSVMPVRSDGNFFSAWTADKTVNILKTPEVFWNADLDLTDGKAKNNLTWDTSSGASGYIVQLTKDGATEEFTMSEAQRAFTYAFADTGKYTVAVKAVAPTGGDYYDSKFSTVYDVERLGAPTAVTQNFIVSDATALGRGFTVTYNTVSGAGGYVLYKDDVRLQQAAVTGNQLTENSVAADTVSETQHYTYSVCSVGSVKGKNIKLGCLRDKGLSFDITVLAMPTALTMEGFAAKWSAVSGSDGYAVDIGSANIYASAATQDLSTIEPGTYSVKVCARGNGRDVLASNYTAPVTVTRLPAPTHIKITAGSGEGLLEYDPVPNASGYYTYLDLSEQALDANASNNMFQYIKTTGTVLHMIATANNYNADKTVYYMTSPASPTQQFVRLEAPTFPEGVFANNVEFQWNAPTNINTSEYTPTYEVRERDVVQTGQKNGTNYNISALKGGKDYIFTVKAIGNGVKYLDSELSVEISIYKLATPELLIAEDEYRWEGVANASAYALYIDGERVDDKFHISGTTYSFKPLFTKTGNHTVKLYAIGDGRTTVDSAPFEHIQAVKVLQTPEITSAYSHETVTPGGYITATVTYPSPNANGYVYELAGETIMSSDLSVTKIIDNAGSFDVKVKARGGKFDDEGVYYVDSAIAGGNSGYKIMLLAAPTLSTFEINSDGVIKWATVQGANGSYEYAIAYDGGAFGEISEIKGASINPLNGDYEKGHSSIRVKVRAVGDGSSTITSAWIEWSHEAVV